MLVLSVELLRVNVYSFDSVPLHFIPQVGLGRGPTVLALDPRRGDLSPRSEVRGRKGRDPEVEEKRLVKFQEGQGCLTGCLCS